MLSVLNGGKLALIHPKMYSWQPNHGKRGPLYTKKPRLLAKSSAKFKRRKVNRKSLAKAIASKRQQAFTLRAPSNRSTKTRR